MLEALNGIYCGPPPPPGIIWQRWNLDPVVILALVALAFGIGRSRTGALAVLVLAVVFLSPLCAASAALFSARTVHHVLLVAVAAPLVAAALPRIGAESPGIHFFASTALFWAWHAPGAYDLALSNMGIYWVMQASLFVPACLFWRSVLATERSPVGALVFVTAGYVQMALLGAVLTFAPHALYEAHQTAPFAWGLTALADQQLAGLIMWVPASIPYAVAGAFLARRGWMTATGAGA